jgi:hypothetical protein
MSVINVKGLFAQITEKGHVSQEVVSESLLGNGQVLFHKTLGKVFFLTTGPNKGYWVAVTKVASMYVRVWEGTTQAPRRRPSYHDHM